MEEKLYFSQVIDDYNVGRAKYPKEIFSTIVDFSGIKKDSRLLEIGAGPGTATDAFLDYSLELLEISDEQVRFLKEKYKDYSNISVKNETFEDFISDISYDLLYSATAFHWIDPDIAYPKAARCLKKGGTLAVFWNVSFGPKAESADFNTLQQIVRKYCPGMLGEKEEDYARSQELRWMQYIYKTGCFTNPVCKEVRWIEKYNVERFISWVKSLQSVYFDKLDSPEFIDEITRYFEEVGGEIEIPNIVFLILTKKIADERDRYQFIPGDEMSTVIQLSELAKYPNIVETHFLNYADEVLYILQDEEIYGIITPRDVTNYFNGSQKSKINRNFRSLREVDYVGAEKIFKEIPNIHEIAVVKDEKLLGIIRSGRRKTPTEWKKIRENMRKLMINDSRLSLNDLFKSLTEVEQKKLLEEVFDSDYVKLFETDYDSRKF